MVKKRNTPDIICVVLQEHSTTYSLVKRIKAESDHTSGASSQFPEIKRLDEQHEYNHHNPSHKKLDRSNGPGFSTGELKKKKKGEEGKPVN